MPRSLLVVSLICGVTISFGGAKAGGYGRSQGPQGMPAPQEQGPSSYSYAYKVPSGGGTQSPGQIYGNGFTTPQGLSSYNNGHSQGQGPTSTTPANLQGPSFTLNSSGGFSYNYTGPQGSSGFSYSPQPPAYQQPVAQSGGYHRLPSMPPSQGYQQGPGDGQSWQRQNEAYGMQYGNDPDTVGVAPSSNDILQSNGNVLSGN